MYDDIYIYNYNILCVFLSVRSNLNASVYIKNVINEFEQLVFYFNKPKGLLNWCMYLNNSFTKKKKSTKKQQQKTTNK